MTVPVDTELLRKHADALAKSNCEMQAQEGILNLLWFITKELEENGRVEMIAAGGGR